MASRDLETQRRILNRLRRANGQLTAIIGTIENGGSCREVVTQLAAVASALDRAGFAIIATAMKDCLAEPAEAGDGDKLTTEELEKLFLMLA